MVSDFIRKAAITAQGLNATLTTFMASIPVWFLNTKMSVPVSVLVLKT